MDIYEITGYKSGLALDGVNFLEPVDSFQNIQNGFIYRQLLQSRLGFDYFGVTQPFPDNTRIMGIFEFIQTTGTTLLLVCTKMFLYLYSQTTNSFTQIPMAGSAPPGGFGITNNNDYVSGTAYSISQAQQALLSRFIFTSRGMSAVYFYDGTNVKVYNNATDNPFYVAPPPDSNGGVFTNATYVSFFGQRMNFFCPVYTGITYNQQVLFSGIATTAGGGDNFNTPGSGSISADTYEYMTGAIVAGDYMVLEFNRSTYTLEKTRDAFTPYFIRKIPSVLGTDASFSAVLWNNQTKSVGKTGFLNTDGKQSLRTDNKIPYFTADEIDQVNFDLIYGGFDRINAQYLFSYRSANSQIISVTQDKIISNNYEESTWSVYDMRFSVLGQTDLGTAFSWNQIFEDNDQSWAQWNTTEEIWNQIGQTQSVQKTLAGDNLGFIYNINEDFDDYYIPVSGITNSFPAAITTSTCALLPGDLITFSNCVGMTQINGMTSVILSGSGNNFTVDIDTSLMGVYTEQGTISKPISFYAETIPFNPYRAEGRKVFMSHVEFLVNTTNGGLIVDFYADEQQVPCKGNIRLQPLVIPQETQWITAIVSQEANFITITMSHQSISAQVIIKSMRIHCKRGGYTSA